MLLPAPRDPPPPPPQGVAQICAKLGPKELDDALATSYSAEQADAQGRLCNEQGKMSSDPSKEIASKAAKFAWQGL